MDSVCVLLIVPVLLVCCMERFIADFEILVYCKNYDFA